METVLGLSMTSNSIGWVLLDGTAADATALDHDHFDLVGDAAVDGDITRHQAVVRGAQAIAAASGHQVRSIAVTWTDDVEPKAALLLKSLPGMGFEIVTAVSLPDAARHWAGVDGRALGYDRCAVCVVESAAVTVASVLYDTARTARTQMRESADGLGRWLSETFDGLRSDPECLYLMGSRGDIELITGPLAEALHIPVVASDDAQLTLARGAALTAGTGAMPAQVEKPAGRQVDTGPVRRVRFGAPLRAATLLAAGLIALFAFGPEIGGPTDNRPAAPDLSAASDSSTTSVSVHAVPSAAALSAPPVVQPQATVAAPPEPLVLNAIAPVTETVEQPVAAAIEAPVVEAPVVDAVQTPVAAPVEAPSVEAVQAQPVTAAPTPLAPAPVVAPPVTAPNPLAPPDPISVALSPLFSGLP